MKKKEYINFALIALGAVIVGGMVVSYVHSKYVVSKVTPA